MRISDWSADGCSSDLLGSEALAGMIGVNGNLLDVCAAVHDLDQCVRHGYVVCVGLNPDVLGREEIVQLVERGRWIVCDGAHPDVSDRFARGADRTSVASGERVSVRVGLGGRRY